MVMINIAQSTQLVVFPLMHSLKYIHKQDVYELTIALTSTVIGRKIAFSPFQIGKQTVDKGNRDWKIRQMGSNEL